MNEERSPVLCFTKIQGVEDLKELSWRSPISAVQLAPGDFKGQIATAMLPELSVSAGRMNTSFRINGTFAAGFVHLVAVTEARGKLKAWGMECKPGNAILALDHSDYDLHFFGNCYKYISISIQNERLAGVLAAHGRGSQIDLGINSIYYGISPRIANHLEDWMPYLFRPFEKIAATDLRELEERIIGAVLDSLLDCKRVIPGESANRERRLLRQTETLMHEKVNSSIEDFCAEFGISRRTLERVFRTGLGISPAQYYTLLRLCRARSFLASGKAESVSQAATEFGFFELGRFSGRYKALFGELPSETLSARRKTLAMKRHSQGAEAWLVEAVPGFLKVV